VFTSVRSLVGAPLSVATHEEDGVFYYSGPFRLDEYLADVPHPDQSMGGPNAPLGFFGESGEKVDAFYTSPGCFCGPFIGHLAVSIIMCLPERLVIGPICSVLPALHFHSE